MPRAQKTKMTREEREAWYTEHWCRLQTWAAMVNKGQWNGTPEEKKAQANELREIREVVLNGWIRQLEREIRESEKTE